MFGFTNVYGAFFHRWLVTATTKPHPNDKSVVYKQIWDNPSPHNNKN